MEQTMEKQMIFGREEPLLSVLIPVYGTQDYIAKALDSVCGQTYRNLEIIVVNDASPDYAEDIIFEYQARDPRIRYIKNEENQGLFHARLRGYEAATGEYIACFDSDDYMEPDYYRSMLFTALRTKADIVVSDFVEEFEEKNKRNIWIQNHLMSGLDLEGKDVFKAFLESEYMVSNWWFMWNKLYKKSLWDACYPILSQVPRKVTYLEDFLYGNIFLSHAQKYVHTPLNSYIYVRHAQACTGMGQPTAQYVTNAQSKQAVFAFLKHYFEDRGLMEQVGARLEQYAGKQRQSDLDKIAASSGSAQEKEEAAARIGEMYGWVEDSYPKDTYFAHTEEYEDRYERVKALICQEDTQVVSFDIFDTLVLRPFYTPEDLFLLLDPRFEALHGGKLFSRFSNMRIEAEARARRQTGFRAPQLEEVTLDDIYHVLAEEYQIPSALLEEMKQLECDLECSMCMPRKSVRELYELARYMGKRVVCTSDIYLERPVVERLLHNAGYAAFDGIYLSSEAGVTKRTGRLFRYVCKELDVEPGAVLHIGDNWKSDIEAARAHKIQTFFIPRVVECFENRIPPNQRGHYTDPVLKEMQGNWLRYKHAFGQLGVRCMCAIAANRMFDNPFLTFDRQTDFNADPYFMGYLALGMHDMGIAKWLFEDASANGYRTIHFVARDGFAVKQVYDTLLQFKPDSGAPKSDYLYLSRKAMLPLIIRSRADLLFIDEWVNIRLFTPRELLELLQPALLELTEEKERAFRKGGVLLDDRLRSVEEFRHFMAQTGRLLYDQAHLEAYRGKMRAYFGSFIQPGDVMFDIGYSGRGQAVLSDLLGYPVDAYYIHTLKDTAAALSRPSGFQIHTFFHYLPTITGRQREMIQSDTGPSCIGYRVTGDGVAPAFELRQLPPMGKYVMQTIHRGMTDFAQDFLAAFNRHFGQMYCDAFSVSFAHEYLMHAIRPKDLRIFDQITFEDDMMEGFQERKLSDIWAKDQRYYALNNSGKPSLPATAARSTASKGPARAKNQTQSDATLQRIYDSSRMKRIAYYLLFDRGTLRAKWKKFFGRKHKTKKNKPGKAEQKIKNAAGLPPQRAVEKADVPQKGETSFYYILSNYQLLCCIAHKLLYNRERKAVVLLSAYRKDVYQRLKNSGIFGDQVYLWDDAALNDYFAQYDTQIDSFSPKQFKQMEREVFDYVEKNLPVSIKGFYDYYLSADDGMIGTYLMKKGISYHYFEDAAGIYTHPEITENNLKRLYSNGKLKFLQQFPINGKNPKIRTVYVKKRAQKEGVPLPANAADLDVMECLKALEPALLQKVLRVFDVQFPALDAAKPVALLLTQQMYAFKKMGKLEQDRLYASLVDYFTQGHQLVVKPHPDDTYSDYRKLFPGCTVFAPKVLAEFLPVLLDVKYDKAITANSMAVYNLEQYVNTIVAFNPEIETTFKQFDEYYVAAALAAKAAAQGYTCVCKGVNMLQANMLLANAGLETDARFVPLEEAENAAKRCVFADTLERTAGLLRPDDAVVLLVQAGEKGMEQVDIRRIPLKDTPLDPAPRRRIWLNPAGKTLWEGLAVVKELTYTGVTLKCEIK